ncbi:MAG: hypothetical protein U0V74_15530 [Chitinophagales bacterium]
MFKKFIIPVMVLFMAGCASNEIGHSKDVNQDEIHQGYSIWYDATKNETNITAFFRFAGPNGTTLILDEPSQIVMDGEPMQKVENGLGCSYQKTIKGQLPNGEHTFAFSDVNGKAFNNSFNWNNVNVEGIPDNISKAENLKIHFDGFKDRLSEKVTVDISDTANTVSETFDRVGLDDKVVIDKEKLQGLNGEVTIRINRYGHFDLKNAAHPGGFISSDYLALEKTAHVVQ